MVSKNKKMKKLNKLAEELRKKALKKGVSELDQCKLLAAYHCLLGQFKEANQYQFQHDVTAGILK